MHLFHGNRCVLWIATCVGLGCHADKTRGNLAKGNIFFGSAFGRKKLFPGIDVQRINNTSLIIFQGA